MKKQQKGFTLVELMVVIVIIGILSALAIPKFLGATTKAKISEFKPVLKQLFTLENAYQQERSVYLAMADVNSGVTAATLANDAKQLGFDPPPGVRIFTYGVGGGGAGFTATATLEAAVGDVDGGLTANINEAGTRGPAANELTLTANWQ